MARQADRIHAAGVDERRQGEHYRPFWELTRAGLRYAALRLGLALDAAAEERLMNQYHHLSSFPENKPVLQALQGARHPGRHPEQRRPARCWRWRSRAPASTACSTRCSACTRCKRYKTDPAAYALGPQALKLPARDILFVSSNGWDAIGATWFGYTTLWVNRAGLPLEQLDTEPTRTGSSLRAVLDFFPTCHPNRPTP